MGILDLFKRKEPATETRSSGAGYTGQIMAARESYLAGTTGLGDLCATVSACVSLWEGAFMSADVTGTRYLDRAAMGLLGRSLAMRGEVVFLIRPDRLIPASDWEVATRDGVPRAYRLSLSEAGGGRTETVLAAEVLHIRLAADPVAPWTGQSPLQRARITAGLLQVLEEALKELYTYAPLGSQVVPFPESPDLDLKAMGSDFRGRRGRVLLRESVNVSAAGGPAPVSDWKPQSLTPDMQKAMTRESLDQARGAIMAAFGILPAMFADNAQGPIIREGQRQLATWTLQPIAMLIAEEASAKLGGDVQIDTLRPLQAYDAGGRARAFTGMIEGMARAKEAGLTPGEVEAALRVVDLE